MVLRSFNPKDYAAEVEEYNQEYAKALQKGDVAFRSRGDVIEVRIGGYHVGDIFLEPPASTIETYQNKVRRNQLRDSSNGRFSNPKWLAHLLRVENIHGIKVDPPKE